MTRGAAMLAGAGTLAALACWTLARAGQPPAPGVAPAASAPGEGGVARSLIAAGPPAERAAAAPLAIQPEPPPATPAAGVVAVLVQPAFSPQVEVADSVWAAFVAAPRGDWRAAWTSVRDRLARLGIETRAERPWAGGALLFERPPVDGAGYVLALTGEAVGLAPLTALGAGATLPLWGVAEADPGRTGEAWGWSASAFPGPHRLGRDLPVPAARLRAVVVAGGDPPLLWFAEEAELRAGERQALAYANRASSRRIPEGSAGKLVLRCEAGRPVELGPFPPRAALSIEERGTPFGTYDLLPAGRR